MPLNLPQDKTKIYLSATLTEPFSPQDKENLESWLRSNVNMLSIIIFDHANESINREIFCDFVDNLSSTEIIVAGNSVKITQSTQLIKLERTVDFLESSTKYYTKINFEENDINLGVIEKMIQRVNFNEFNCNEYNIDKIDRSFTVKNLSMTKMLTLLSSLKNWLKSVTLPRLIFTKNEFESLVKLSQSMLSCNFFINDISISDYDVNFIEKLISEFSNINWDKSSTSINNTFKFSSPFNLLIKLIERNKLIEKIKKHEPLDYKLNFGGLYPLELHLDFIIAYCLKQTQLINIVFLSDNSVHTLKFLLIVDKLAGALISKKKSINLTIDNTQINIHEGVIKNLSFEEIQLEKMLSWWRKFKPEKNELILNIKIHDKISVDVIIEFCTIAAPSKLILNSFMLIPIELFDLKKLCNILQELSINCEVDLESFSANIIYKKINNLSVNSSLIEVLNFFVNNNYVFNDLKITSQLSRGAVNEVLFPLFSYCKNKDLAIKVNVNEELKFIVEGLKIKEISINTKDLWQYLSFFIKNEYSIEKLILSGSLLFECDKKRRVLDILIDLLVQWQKNTSFKIIPYNNYNNMESIVLELEVINSLAEKLVDLINFSYDCIGNNEKSSFNYSYISSNEKRSFKFIMDKIIHRNCVMQKLTEHTSKENLKELTHEKNIHTLNLSNYLLTNNQLLPILPYLRVNKDIQTLNISENPLLTENGLIDLLEGLKEIPWITKLIFRGLNINDSVIQKLNEYLKKNYLLFLDLGNNKLKDSALTIIKNSIQENRSLISLDITQNEFSSSNSDSLSRALLENKVLTHFYCDLVRDNATVEAFFKGLKWISAKKVNNEGNFRLKEIELISLSRGTVSVQYMRSKQLKDLSSESKLDKQLVTLYDKFINGGKSSVDKLSMDIIDLSRNGKDLERFKVLLKNASPYTKAQEGYLQHVLVSNEHLPFLKYLFDGFSINPWLRSDSGETILELSQKKNNIELQIAIEEYITKFKKEPAVTLKRDITSKTSDSKRTKPQVKDLSADITPLLATPSSSSSSFRTDAGHLLLKNDVQPMQVDIPLPQRSYSLPSASLAFSPAINLVANAQVKVTLIMQAMQTNNIALLEKFLSEPDWQEATKPIFIQLTHKNPLRYAFQTKALAVIDTLIRFGEEINEQNEASWPIIYEFISGFYEKQYSSEVIDEQIKLLKKLIDCGADLNFKVTDADKAQNTIIHKAAQMGNYRCLKMLLTHPVCVLNERNSQNLTPLDEAIRTNQTKMVCRLLLDRRHSRATILKASEYANVLKFEIIKNILDRHLAKITDDKQSSGLQWSKSLNVQFFKPAKANLAFHSVALDKEHVWLHSQNQFTQQSMALSLSTLDGRAQELEKLGNPVTASLTFVLTSTAYIRHSPKQFVDITIPLQSVAEYHLTQAFSAPDKKDEKEAIVSREDLEKVLPHYENFRHGYAAASREIIDAAADCYFAQTFRHGERSLLTYLAKSENVQKIVLNLTQQAGFTPYAKCIGIILNVASPRYACENCEVALLATQNPRLSKFLPILSEELRQANVQLPQFSSLRMITCISSYSPFHSDRIPAEKHQLLEIDFRQNDVLLSKDISQVSGENSYTQFRSNQTL